MSTSTLQVSADAVVANYSQKRLSTAIERTERLRSGDKKMCYCKSCICEAVAEANLWLEFFNSSQRYAVVNVKGKLTIDIGWV